MIEKIISFLHIGDTHFGVYYAKKPRDQLKKEYSNLFFTKTEEVIKQAIISHKVDFIVHSGDFFNRSKPPPEVVDRAVKPFSETANNGIPIYLLPGNHERSKLPFGLLHYQDNINVFKNPKSFTFKKDGVIVRLTGFPYIRHYAKNKFTEVVKQASKDNYQINPHYKILVAHQLIEGSRVYNYVFRSGHNVVQSSNVPMGFNYIACGHVHRFQFLRPQKWSSSYLSASKSRFIEQDCINRNWNLLDDGGHLISMKDPIIAYPGSLERVSMAERFEPKGFIIGKLFFSDKLNQITRAEYRFQEIESIRMIYQIWNLSELSSEEYIENLIKELYEISENSSSHDKNLNGVIRIKIQGQAKLLSTELARIKNICEKLNFYVTFSSNF
ncbi:MAG: metallophosphoesterase family protein [Candidatus Hodarchaeales archaeon]